MKIGTKSVLFGAHAFWHHPFAVALGWWQLYGFPWHPALWLCFFFHDVGYIGKPNMDGEEGRTHPELGAMFVWLLTGMSDAWYEECLYHSRQYAKAAGKKPSRLCYADKLASCYTPAPIYLLGTGLSGELDEYMAFGKVQEADVRSLSPAAADLIVSDNAWNWYRGLRLFGQQYVKGRAAS